VFWCIVLYFGISLFVFIDFYFILACLIIYLCCWCFPLGVYFNVCLFAYLLDTTLCNKVCQWLAAGRWFSPVSSTNKTGILLKVALNTITLTLNIMFSWLVYVVYALGAGWGSWLNHVRRDDMSTYVTSFWLCIYHLNSIPKYV
jgi:hypothetical protein